MIETGMGMELNESQNYKREICVTCTIIYSMTILCDITNQNKNDLIWVSKYADEFTITYMCHL